RSALHEDTQCTFVLANEVAADRMKAAFEHTVGADVLTLAEWLGEKKCASYDVALLPQGLAFHEEVPVILKGIQASLLAGGMLAMVETEPHASINLLEGADPAWWSAESNGHGVCRLATADAWTEALDRAGFAVERADEASLALSPRLLLVGTKKKDEKTSEALSVENPVRVLIAQDAPIGRYG
ncbi:hypothetical protein EVA_09330, partial [gut metagenome]